VHYLTAAADLVVTANAGLFGTAVPVWLNELLDGVESMLRGIQAWGHWTSAMIGAFQVAATDLMNVDLMPWVVRNVLNDWVADHVPVPTVTLDDLVTVAVQGHPGVRDRIDRFLNAADRALWVVDWIHDVSDLRRKVAALRTIFNLTLTATPFTYSPDVLPTGPIAGLPDVYEALFGGTLRAELLAAVSGAGAELRGSLHDIGIAGANLAAGLAATAGDEMRRQARAGAGLELGERWRAEGALVADLFQPLRADLGARTAAEPEDQLAAGFDQAVSAAGIVAAAQAVPAYVGQLRRFWEVRSAQREYPTSAHILARRGQLAMVRVPRLTMNAPDRAPDDALASETADRFQDVVRGAYREGRARITQLARPAGEPSGARVGGGVRRGR
jgi:hypothetical protein